MSGISRIINSNVTPKKKKGKELTKEIVSSFSQDAIAKKNQETRPK
jgi:hypothetical protein